MQEGLLDRIKSKGYWRINFKPAAAEAPMLLQRCLEIVESNRVQLRGWDYPHVQRNEEHGGRGPAGEYYESWTDWSYHIEFWRMYRSSQFLHYLAIREDWVEESERGNLGLSDGRVLGVVSAIYTLTEIFEFVSRLVRSDLFRSGLSVDLTLNNTDGRRLWINESRRMGFFEPRVTLAETIHMRRDLSAGAAIDDAGASVRSLAEELFDNFGWSSSEGVAEDIRSNFLSGRYE